MPGARIALVDFGDTGVGHAEMQKCARALLQQVNTQFALPPPLGWGISVQAVRVATPKQVAKDEWVIGLYASLDVPHALGYHDRTPSGMPFMEVSPPLDRSDGVPWQTTASHELLETLYDPELGVCWIGPDGQVWAAEMCDAVEADTYTIAGVPVSNWVCPPWAQPPDVPGPWRFDWLGKCNAPLEIRPGGYGQYLGSDGWQEVDAQRVRAMRQSLGRRGRRARRREKWAAHRAHKKAIVPPFPVDHAAPKG